MMVTKNLNETENVQQPQDAGQVNSQARKTVQDIVGEAVNQDTAAEQERRERLNLLESMRITCDTQVPEEQYALQVDGVGFFALGDVHGLKAKQKQGKTSMLKVCAAALLNKRQFRVESCLGEPKVLWLDTEQKPADVKLILTDIIQMTGLDKSYVDSHLLLYPLRKMTYDTLMDDLRLLTEEHQPQVVVVDGVVEFVASFNDEVTSHRLINDLKTLCDDGQCAIINVLHENKSADDVNMRGHLGTFLSQAAGTVLQCHKSQRGIITVSCSDPRHGTMPSWSIAFDAEGHLYAADLQAEQEEEQRRNDKRQKRIQESEQLTMKRVEAALLLLRDNGGSMKRNELTTALVEQLQVSRTTVSRFITSQIGKAFVEVEKSIRAMAGCEMAF